MYLLQAHRGLAGDLDDVLRGQATLAREPIVKALALEQLHHQEGTPGVRADVIDVANIRAPNLGRGARFAHEPLGDHLGAGELGGQDFHRHPFADVHVLGFVDGRHSTSADLLTDAELPVQYGSDRHDRGVFQQHPESVSADLEVRLAQESSQLVW
jgi:hypothetical protein